MTSLVNASSLIDLTAVAFAVASVVQLTKFGLDYLIKPTSPNHTNIVRLYVYIIATGVVILYSSANTVVAFTGQFVTGVLTAVLTVGTGAILQYNLLNGLSSAPLPGLAGPASQPLPMQSEVPTVAPENIHLEPLNGSPSVVMPGAPVGAVPVTPAPVKAVSTPASDPAQRV